MGEWTINKSTLVTVMLAIGVTLVILWLWNKSLAKKGKGFLPGSDKPVTATTPTTGTVAVTPSNTGTTA